MITRRNLLWIIPALLIFSFPLWRLPVASYLAPPETSEGREAPGTAKAHDFTMTGVTIEQSENGKMTAIIQAVKAHTGELPDEYVLDEVNSDIFNEQGDLTNVTADTGLYNGDKKQLHLVGNVVIHSEADKFTVKTNILHYDEKKRTVYSPKETHLQGDGITIQGSSFNHNMDSGVYSVGGRVYCTLQGYKGS